jgi:hypothetical protein
VALGLLLFGHGDNPLGSARLDRVVIAQEGGGRERAGYGLEFDAPVDRPGRKAVLVARLFVPYFFVVEDFTTV